MRIKIATFVKTPGMSSIKTRLAASSTRPLADRFYDLSLAALDEWMVFQNKHGAEHWECYWAVAEAACVASTYWQSRQTRHILEQGNGDLGMRLHRVYAAIRGANEPAVLVGADAPQLSVDLIDQVRDALKNGAEVCVGPSTDGGFYLFASALPLTATTWTNVEYSQSTTLAQLLSQTDLRDRKVARLEALTDVDEKSDLTTLRDQLRKLGPKALESQKHLLSWLDTLSD